MSTGLRFQAPELLLLLWTVPVIVALVWASLRHARRRRVRFTELWPRLTGVNERRRYLREALAIGAICLVVIGLARPSWDSRLITVQQRARDVAIVVDVSQSMLAEDVQPSRLRRAQIAITDALPVMRGDRVAVVAFAGSSRVVAPLTRDFHFVEWAVESLTPRSVEKGGSLIGDAIRKVGKDVFDPKIQRRKEVIVISDGGDQGSFPREAASAAAQQGIRIVAIGIGNPNEDSPIPIPTTNGETQLLRNQGQVVQTRLQAEPLRAMADATPNGRYIGANTSGLNLAGIYRDLMGTEEGRELGEVEIYRQIERFQYFLGPACALLLASFFIRDRQERRS
jgi:Ca-activated chloride channel family protein